ncbi:MAG: hypothetical protein K0S78_6317 [Thermomicrobiales bacterium]|nr:hypothetical protein [Thermomicrobiales bacterium]
MSVAEGGSSPLRLTRSPRLDNALRLGWESFSRTLAAAGPRDAARWLSARTGDPQLAEVAEPLLTSALGRDPDEAADALFGLAELAEETEDELLADTLWEGVLDRARVIGEGDLVAEATRRLAALAERNGDPLAAAEFFIEFLNWRRQPGNSSDPEDVEVAFDEIVRLATADGAQQAAAQYAYRQVGFTKLLDADDPRAVDGDWESDAPAYQSWA